MTQKALLVKVMKLVIDSKVCPETDAKEWAKLILYAHTKGFLYLSDDMKTVVCAYRSDEEDLSEEMPIREGGKHLHCIWAASESVNTLSLLKMMKSYLKQNKGIEKVIYYRRNSNTDKKVLNVSCRGGRASYDR